jgi:hypothetical protein
VGNGPLLRGAFVMLQQQNPLSKFSNRNFPHIPHIKLFVKYPFIHNMSKTCLNI